MKNIRDIVLNKTGNVLFRLDRQFQIISGYINCLFGKNKNKIYKQANYLNDTNKKTMKYAHFSHNLLKTYDFDKIVQTSTLFSENEDRLSFMAEVSIKIFKQFDEDVAEIINTFTDDVLCKYKEELDLRIKSGAVKRLQNEGVMDIYQLYLQYVTNQYTYKNFVTIDVGDVFIDCGALYGETSALALNSGADIVYAFEPSHVNFEILSENARVFNGKIVPINAGVGEKNEEVFFYESIENKSSSSFMQKENVSTTRKTMQILTIDNWARENAVSPSFIKMDIEGFELNALKGSIETLKKFKPKLAICLYHKLEDMWKIPLFLHDMNLGYSFWFKKNAHSNEFVLYAAVR